MLGEGRRGEQDGAEMSDLEDFELGEGDPAAAQPPADPPGNEPRSPLAILGLALLLLVAIGAAVFLVLRHPSAEPAALPSTQPPLGATASPVENPPAAESRATLPSVEDSDPFVREQAAGLSSHPQLAVWLATRGLVRIFATSVLNIADGRSPAPLVPFLAPKTKFSAASKGGRLLADPQSFAAYDELANAVASLDTAGVARVYGTCLPLLNAAYAELGYPNADFSQTTERAIARLLETPAIGGEVALRKGPLFYQYADPALEGLSFAQKQLLRTGPRNVKLLQGKLRDLYRELGFTPHS